MGDLLLVRHGATGLNAETPGAERIRGWLDVPLATAGIYASRRAARALAGVPIQKLYTSDLKRAQDTARIMSVTLGATVESTKALRPWNLGDYAGQPVSDIADVLASYCNGKRKQAVPNGESFATFLTRWKDALLALLKEAQASDGNIVAVTHARNLYALQELLFNEEIPVKGPPHPGSIVSLSGPWGQVMYQTVFLGDTGRPQAGS